MSVNFKKLMESDKTVVGTKQVLAGLKRGEIATVYLASNCPTTTAQDAARYAKLSNAKLETLTVPNSELGTLCRKPYAIALLGVRK